METKDTIWLPKEGALPAKFVTGLLGYLTSEEKGELAETHVEWAKRIIRSDSGLAVAHVRSESILDWVEVELSRWEKLANTLEDVPDRQWNDLVDLARLCHSLLQHELPRDDGVWIVIDREGQLQALATAESEDGADSHEIHELLTAPWNLWRRDNTNELHQDLPSPVRGAGTLATAAIALSSTLPLDLSPLKDAVPFYLRCGFKQDVAYHYRLTTERAKARLGHLPIQRLTEKELLLRITN